MNRTATLLLVGMVLLSTVPTATGTTTQNDLVTVTVTVENEAGQPVSGAELTATWEGGNRTATTASNGQALIDVPRGADVSIDVRSDDYVRNTPYEITDATQQSVTITVAQKGTATVRVLDSNGAPVNNAVVQLFHDGELVVNTRTNASGVYRTDAIEQGEYTLRAFKERYYANGTSFDVTGDVSVSTRIKTGSVLVSFNVKDDHFDPARPVEGATISIPALGDTSRTLSDGEATTSVPVNTRFQVEITKQGYETVTKTLRVNEERTSLNASIQRTEALNLAVSNSQVIVNETVTADVENEYGNVIKGATITVDGETVGTTGENGALTFRIRSPGVHAIRAKSGDLSDNATVEGFRPGNGTPEDTATEAPTTEDESTTSSGIGPGFTPVAAVVAALLVALVLRRRT